MSKKKVIEVVKDILNPFLIANGYELFDAEYVKEGKDWFLRIYIDKEDGISLDDCEKVSNYLSSKLDEVDPIETNYLLEVSSPGIDRPLIKDSDYVKYKGRIVEVFLYKAINSEKVITGVLEGLERNFIILSDENQENINIPRDIVSKVKLAVIF
ncbi:MAG: ribosome maturation factor RimP [Clostridiales bacterium]|nr:ribosome maturation factor RimP [Clostridiales bacterium]